MSDWKPGDLWIVECETWAPGELRAVRYDSGWYWLDDCDYFTNDGNDTPAHRPVSPLRPLLVIDPEDREQVQRLIRASVGNHSGCPDALVVTEAQIDHMQAALREFAKPTPPKPDEPKGLGAVVELADGRKAVRTWQPIQPWSHFRDGLNFLDAWGDIDVIRVVSEGVSA